MTEPGDAMRPVASAPAMSPDVPDAAACASSQTPVHGAPDDRAVRRAALRELAAMVAVEVFY